MQRISVQPLLLTGIALDIDGRKKAHRIVSVVYIVVLAVIVCVSYLSEQQKSAERKTAQLSLKSDTVEERSADDADMKSTEIQP